MKKWVKLFEVEGAQVLFYIEPDGDDMIVHQCVTMPDGIFADVALHFRNDVKDKSRLVFDAIDEAVAGRVLKMVHEMLADDDEDAGREFDQAGDRAAADIEAA